MKKYIIWAVCILPLLVAALIALHRYSLDGLDGFVFSLLLGEDTVYVSGYSDSGFRQVQSGMTISEVHTILGPPIDHWERSGTYGERWTKSAHDSDYRCRVLLFENGKVTEKHTEFYVD